MKVLITGGEGFIGQNLQAIFNTIGVDYVSMDFDLSNKLNPGDDRSVWGDITSRLMSTSNLQAVNDVTHIIHLAAVTGIQAGLERPWNTFWTNVGGTANILDLARSTEVQAVILASSMAADWAKHPYGASKRAMEQVGISYRHTYGMNVTSVRFPNVFGPFSQHKTTVVSQFIQAALANKPLMVHDLGHQERTFVYAPDLCRIIYRLLHERNNSAILEVGGYQSSIIGLAKTILELTGSESRVEHTDANPFEPPTGLQPGTNQTYLQPKSKTADHFRLNLQHTIKWFERVPWHRPDARPDRQPAG